MDFGHQLVGVGRDDRERPEIHSQAAGFFQFSHKPAIPNGAPFFMAIA
jgi:hypothetical protein